MLNFLPGPVIGVIAMLFYLFATVFWAVAIYVLAFITYIIPNQRWRSWWHKKLHAVPDYWASWHHGITKLTCKIDWDIQGIENLKTNDWYLMIANHQTWADILILQQTFVHHTPPLTFFMKNELKWQLPLAAQACWLLDFPFMQRHSKEYLQKHPEKKGSDIATTRKACKKLKTIPTTIINFVEGGRYTEEKHTRQKSSFKYLLKPKAGGIAFALASMGDFMHTLLDVTLVYPDGRPTFWDFVSGRVHHIVVRVRQFPITKDLMGDYENDRNFRVHFHNWLNQIWTEKDALIGSVLQHSNPAKSELLPER